MRSALAALLTCFTASAIEREVAVTFDDLAPASFAPKLQHGTFFAGEPATPQWIQDLAGINE